MAGERCTASSSSYCGRHIDSRRLGVNGAEVYARAARGDQETILAVRVGLFHREPERARALDDLGVELAEPRQRHDAAARLGEAGTRDEAHVARTEDCNAHC